MAEKVLIYGKSTWPYTNSAREAYQKSNADFEYIDVIVKKDRLDEMLKHTNGTSKVPVIVEQGKVTIGYDGGSWGIWGRPGGGFESD